ncbi:MAG: DUF4349 domain-containing protein [Flavobacteriales bacterium]|nr:DUF4349 domain-containing protein [Flavobacteriales bacterium]
MRPIPIITAILFLLACGNNRPGPESANSYQLEEPAAAEGTFAKNAPMDAGGQSAVPLPAERKIIRTGSLTYEVDDLDAARTAILERVKAEGGYAEGDDRGEWGNIRSVTLRVRIPADRFDAFVEGMSALGRLENRSINAADVTTEWVDVEARLEAKRAVEKRYLELAAQAKSVQEMLEVERELGNVRAEIESMEARMKSLRDQVGMSTLSITCQKRVAVSERFSPRFGVALREGWNNLLRFLVGLTHLWPFVVSLAGVLLWWRWRRKRTK